jgi:hypothetical protein
VIRRLVDALLAWPCAVLSALLDPGDPAHGDIERMRAERDRQTRRKT